MEKPTREELIRFIKDNSEAFSGFQYFSIMDYPELLEIKNEIEKSLPNKGTSRDKKT